MKKIHHGSRGNKIVRLAIACLAMAGGRVSGEQPSRVSPDVPAGPMSLEENRWTMIAPVAPDPLGRELEPGRGAYWLYEPGSGRFLRYGGYTPTECNALWTFDLRAREWKNPIATDYSWPPPTNRPGAGAWWSMAYDAKRSVVWLFGGHGLVSRKRPELINDIWRFDPATGTFTAMKSKNPPSFSGGCRIVYDAKNDLIVRAPAGYGMHNRDRTWVYDPETNAWEGRATPGMPSVGLAKAFVFDPVGARAVYLAHGKDRLTDTWTYDAAANAWAQLETAERPPARVVAGVAYDAASRHLIVCGGVGHAGKGYGYLYRGGGVRLTDTWALDLAAGQWKKLDVGAPEIPKLPGERHGTRFEHFIAMDYDAKQGAIVLSAPTVGVWALRFRPQGAPPRTPLALAALPSAPAPAATDQPVFPMAPPNPKLLELKPNVWVQLDGGSSIGGGEVPLIYDEATGYMLKYGGCNNGGAGTFASGYGNDLSAYDPATERWIALRWVDPCGPPRPANGCTRGYAYDPVRKVNWFAGGTAGNYLAYSLPPDFSGAFENATWRYDGQRDRFELVPSSGRTPHGWDRVVCAYDRSANVFNFNAQLFDPESKTWSAEGEPGLPVMTYVYACYVNSLKGMFVVRPQESGSLTLLHDANRRAWRELKPGGDPLPARKGGGPITAYDPENDVVICVFDKKTYAYDVKANKWRTTGVETPDVREMIAFDTRHKVFLATAAMGRHMWAFRYGATP